MLLIYLRGDEYNFKRWLEDKTQSFSLYSTLTMVVVFVVHYCITFQVYNYNLSYQLSSQLLRRNHAFLTFYSAI